MSETTAGAVGASASIIGGFVAVFAVAFTATTGPRWTADDAARPQQPLVIRDARHARHDVTHTRPHAVRVTGPVTLPARAAPRVAAVRAVRRVRPVARHHATRRAHHTTAPAAPAVAPVAPPAPVTATSAAPATPAPAPAPVVTHEKKIPPGQLKKQAAAAHVPPGQLKKDSRAAVLPAVGQTPSDEGDRGRAGHPGNRGRPHALAG